MIRRSRHILLIAIALLGIANFAVADEVYYCVGDSRLDGETTGILTIFREKRIMQMEATYPKRAIGPKTIKHEFDLEPAERHCSLCEMQMLIAGDVWFVRRNSSAFKRSLIFNEKTLELKYYSNELSERGMYTDLWTEWQCIKSK